MMLHGGVEQPLSRCVCAAAGAIAANSAHSSALKSAASDLVM
jgi:hypothetical protein